MGTICLFTYRDLCPTRLALEPLLFLIYINDLPLMSSVFDMLMYADDTTLYCNIS